MVNVQFIKSVLQLFVITFCLIAIMLLGGEWVLQTHFASISQNISAISSQHSNTNQTIIHINTSLEKIDFYQKKYVLWTPIIEELFSTIPESVTISSLEISHTDGLLKLSGVARDREALLALKTSLESLPYIDTVEIPLSLLLKKELLSFSLVIPMGT